MNCVASPQVSMLASLVIRISQEKPVKQAKSAQLDGCQHSHYCVNASCQKKDFGVYLDDIHTF